MRRLAELCWSAALLAQGRVAASGLCCGWGSGLGVVSLGLLLLLFVTGQAEEGNEGDLKEVIIHWLSLCRGKRYVDMRIAGQFWSLVHKKKEQ